MFNKIKPCFGAILLVISFQICITTRIEEIFERLEIVSDLLIPAPKEECNVTYFHNLTNTLIGPGEHVPFEFRPITPKVTWPVSDNETLYTLYLTGITKSTLAMGRNEENSTQNLTKIYPFGYEWHNWIVINIPENRVKEGKTIYEYMPLRSPSEMKTTDRFVYLIFKQNGTLKLDPPLNEKAYLFNELSTIKDFVKKYKLGDPAFGSCVLNKWVPMITVKYSDENF